MDVGTMTMTCYSVKRILKANFKYNEFHHNTRQFTSFILNRFSSHLNSGNDFSLILTGFLILLINKIWGKTY
jgi:uncharacterized membrane protein YjjP (DUF1212 family)